MIGRGVQIARMKFALCYSIYLSEWKVIARIYNLHSGESDSFLVIVVVYSQVGELRDRASIACWKPNDTGKLILFELVKMNNTSETPRCYTTKKRKKERRYESHTSEVATRYSSLRKPSCAHPSPCADARESSTSQACIYCKFDQQLACLAWYPSCFLSSVHCRCLKGPDLR